MSPAYKPTLIEGALKSASVFTMLLCTSVAIPTQSQALDGSFNKAGSDTPYDWDTAANWVSNTIANGAGHYALFTNTDISSELKIQLNTSRTVGHIVIGDRGLGTRAAINITSLNNSVLTFDNFGEISTLIQTSTSSANTIFSDILLNNDLRVQNKVNLTDNSQLLTLSGTISAGTEGLKRLVFGGNSPLALGNAPVSSLPTSSGVNVTGAIVDGAGKVQVVIDNPTGSIVQLNGNNSFTGGMVLRDGIVQVNSITSLGNGTFTIEGGAIATLSGSPRLTFSEGAKNILFNGDITALNGTVLDLASTGNVSLMRDVNISVLSSQFGLLGKIDDGGQSHSITKTGTGTFYFSNNGNTFSGGLNIYGGRVILGNLGSLGSGSVDLKYGGALGLYSASVNQTLLNRLTKTSSGYFGSYYTAVTVTGNINMTGYDNLVFGSSSGVLTLTGNLTGSNDIIRVGAWSGSITNFSSALQGDGVTVMVGQKGSASGTVIFNAENTYTGQTIVQGGVTLKVQGQQGGISESSDIVLRGNTNFHYDTTEATAAISDTFGKLILESGESNVSHVRATDFNSSMTFSEIERNQGATVNFSVSGTGSSASGNRTIVSDLSSTPGFIDQGFFYAGVNYAAVDNDGHLRAMVYGSDANAATVAGGQSLSNFGSKHVEVTGNLTNQASASIQTLKLNGNHSITLQSGSRLDLTRGGIIKIGAGTSTIQGGTLSAGSNELIIRLATTSDILNIRSNISADSTKGITLSGAGVVNLYGNNAYSGATTVNGGTLRFLGSQALGAGDIVLNGGIIDIRETTATGRYATLATETFNLGNNFFVNGDASLVVTSVDGVARYQNKILQFGNLTIGGNTLSVTNANGFGAEFVGTTTLSKGTFGNTTFNIANTRPSTLVPGLTLSGKVTGESRISVRGNGTLHLSNASNDFVGEMWVTQGVLSVANDGAMGHANNKVVLIDSTTTSTFRATGTFETDRVIQLGNSISNRNVLQVTQDHVLTLNTAFEGSAGFVKSENGILALNQNNTAWDGSIFIHDGVVEVRHQNALGTTKGYTQVASDNAAVHLNGNLELDETFYIYGHGKHGTGAILAKAGNSILSGQILLSGEATMGVGAGSTLTLSDTSKITTDPTTQHNYAAADVYKLTLTGQGEGFVNSAVNLGNNTLLKNGSGEWTFTNTLSTIKDVSIQDGTLTLSGAQGKIQTQSATRVIVGTGGNLVLDNRVDSLSNRLGNNAVYLGGHLSILGKDQINQVDTISGVFRVTGNGQSTITLESGQQGNLTLNLTNNAQGFTRFGQGTLLVRGNQLGSDSLTSGTHLFAPANVALFGLQDSEIPATQGIYAWALAANNANGFGDSFATYDAVSGIRALKSSEQTSALAADSNVKIQEIESLVGIHQINSLQLEQGGGLINQSGNTVIVSSGGVLAKEGNTGIHGGILTTENGRDLVVHTLGDLEIEAKIATTAGLSKAGQGELLLSQQQNYLGSTSINQGTLKLNGGHQTLAEGQILNINHGGTLDLNGNNQTFGTLRTLGSAVGEVATLGGTITNSGSLATLVTNVSAANTFAGKIEGNLNLVRSNSFVLEANQSWDHTGKTLLNGGITRLTGNGAITQSSELHVQYGTLQLQNHFQSGNSNRLADEMKIVLNGGVINLYGRPGESIIEQTGEVTLQSGLNVLTSSAGTNAAAVFPQSSQLKLGALVRNDATAATVNFGQTYSQTSTEALGLLTTGSSTASSMNILVDGGVTLDNKIVGPWTVTTGFYSYSVIELTSYDEAGGFGALQTTGFAGYDATALSAAVAANHNVRLTGTGTILEGGMQFNAIAVIGNATATDASIKFVNASDLLKVNGGIMTFSLAANTTAPVHKLGNAVNEGRVTSGYANSLGGVDLYLYYSHASLASALQLNAAFVDNAESQKALRLVLNGTTFGQYPYELASNQNAYTGGTVLNNANVRLSGNLGTGGLTLNGSQLTQLAGGVLSSQDVTLNGASVLTLTGNNSLQTIRLNNSGSGISQHTYAMASAYSSYVANKISLGSSGFLQMQGDVYATSSNMANTALISDGLISLNGATRTFDVGAVEWDNTILSTDIATLEIASAIMGGANDHMRKTGAGLLKISGNNMMTGKILIEAGGIIVASNSALGQGRIELSNGATLSADNSIRSVNNQIYLTGDATLGLRSSTGALSFLGGINLGSGTRTLTVNSTPLYAQGLDSQVTGSGILIKKGQGTLALNSLNDGSLDLTQSKAIQVLEGTLSMVADSSLGKAPLQVVADNMVLDQGTLGSTGYVTLHANRGVVVGSQTKESVGTLDVGGAGSRLSYAGVIANHGTHASSLVKKGEGDLVLMNQNTYTGDTYVNQGALVLESEGSIESSRHIHVAKEASINTFYANNRFTIGEGKKLTLGGKLYGHTTLSANATLATSNSRDSSNTAAFIYGDLNATSSSTLLFQLHQPSFLSTDEFGGEGNYQDYFANLYLSNQDSNRLVITGTFEFETGLTIRVENGDATPEYGQIFDLMDWGTLSPTETGLYTSEEQLFNFDLPSLAAYNLEWDVSQFSQHGILVVIPEPSRALLLIFGLGAFLLRRRR